MPIEFTLETLGDTQVQRTFLRFGERALESKELFQQAIKDLMLIERVQFLTEGQHGSGGWAALKPATIAAKRRKGQPEWILRATEALFKSLTEEGAPGNIHEAFSNFMRFGTSLKQGRFAQHGTSKMPARKVVELTSAERVEITRQVQRFIVTGEVQSIYA